VVGVLGLWPIARGMWRKKRETEKEHLGKYRPAPLPKRGAEGWYEKKKKVPFGKHLGRKRSTSIPWEG